MFAKIAIAIVWLIGFWPVAGQALSLSPARAALTLDPGGTRQFNLVVGNNSAVTTSVEFKITGASQDEKGYPIFISGTELAESWISIKPATATLAPGQSLRVAVKVSVPAEAFPGSHHLGVAATTIPPPGATVGLKEQVVGLFTIVVAGVVTERLEVESLAVPSLLIQKPKTHLTVRLKNSGTVPVNASGSFSLFFSGRPIASNNLSLGNALIPQAYRAVTLPAAAAGNMRWPGQYRLEMEIKYGADKHTIVRSAVFWYFPLWTIIPLLLVGVIISGSITYRKRWAGFLRRLKP